ncbi:uncharacterized protein LOC125423214 [Ziziphus jujuba]|uniref:Uncharacterized protein LOC125423214 n=1 Tax=Ziziphus jujuba TaxID=326968 RepID=A0ABM3IPL6_ZIZJJ|nr:uncharacterized protein LOC125423214 [Ziziphus jujuba]
MAKRREAEKQRCSSNSSSSSSNWAGLHDDLLDLILEKLVHLSDIIRFSSVCKPWSSKALIHQENIRKLINHQPPGILLSSIDLEVSQERKLSLYNLFDSSDQILNNKLHIPPEYKNHECIGSSYGWLFYKDVGNRVIQLLNPICGTVIPLPPISIPGKKNLVPFNDFENFTLSSDPSLGSFEVLTIRSDCLLVAHLKFGDEFWTCLLVDEGIEIPKFTFYKNFILGFDSRSSKLFSLDIIRSSNGSSRSPELREIAVVPNKVSYGFPFFSTFVETTNGELLMVHRYWHNQTRYKIFKTICLNGQFDIIPVDNLDGHCLFFRQNFNDSNLCISVLASNFAGCRANSIYYPLWFRIEGCNLKFTIQEFNLEDESVQINTKSVPISNTGSSLRDVFLLVPSIKHARRTN